MTPKEKAEELVGKYMFLLNVDLPITKAKYSAIITVDEIIANIEPSVSMDVISARIKYWEQVKIEINNL
jgi:hypothetical protein